jgi:hypothetical protein
LAAAEAAATPNLPPLEALKTDLPADDDGLGEAMWPAEFVYKTFISRFKSGRRLQISLRN